MPIFSDDRSARRCVPVEADTFPDRLRLNPIPNRANVSEHLDPAIGPNSPLLRRQSSVPARLGCALSCTGGARSGNSRNRDKLPHLLA